MANRRPDPARERLWRNRLARWKGSDLKLSEFCDTEAGFLNIDNNASERALRAVAIGRKNYLFAGSDAGGRAAAVLHSVVGTCRRLGLDPFAYLRVVLLPLPGQPTIRLDEVLPTTGGRVSSRCGCPGVSSP